MKKKEIQALVLRVPHQRLRNGIENPLGEGTYIRFTYKCKRDCVRCALEKAVGLR